MTAHVDTGFLGSLYAPDAHSAVAITHMRRQALPLPCTWLHQLELRNALRLRVFRREITAPQRDASLNAVLADLAAGVLAVAAVALAAGVRVRGLRRATAAIHSRVRELPGESLQACGQPLRTGRAPSARQAAAPRRTLRCRRAGPAAMRRGGMMAG